MIAITQRQHQRVAAVGARTGNDSAERPIEWIGHGDDETDKASAASRSQQSQQEAHSQQSINHVEDVIDDLRNARCAAPRSTFAFVCTTSSTPCAGSRQRLVNRRGLRRFCCGAFGDFRLHFAFDRLI
jgi:hypothetical protein